MGALFSSPKMPATPTVVQAPAVTDPSIAQAQRDAELAQAQAQGRASTILTGGQGDTSRPDTRRSTLLGGGRAL